MFVINIIKNKWSLLLVNFFITICFFLISAPQQDLFHYINVLFYVGYPYLTIGLLLLVIKGGFFNGITYSFRRFHGRMSKSRDYMDDWEKKPMPSERVEVDFLKGILFQGFVLMGSMVLLLVIFYQIA